jgi:hypothetical protein
MFFIFLFSYVLYILILALSTITFWRAEVKLQNPMKADAAWESRQDEAIYFDVRSRPVV